MSTILGTAVKAKISKKNGEIPTIVGFCHRVAGILFLKKFVEEVRKTYCTSVVAVTRI
jgi:hypothetical protein